MVQPSNQMPPKIHHVYWKNLVNAVTFYGAISLLADSWLETSNSHNFVCSRITPMKKKKVTFNETHNQVFVYDLVPGECFHKSIRVLDLCYSGIFLPMETCDMIIHGTTKDETFLLAKQF